MTDFRVVPDALPRNVTEIQETADAWRAALSAVLAGGPLGADDLGILGKTANVVDPYNGAHGDALSRLQQGVVALDAAAAALRTVADEYERHDARYYRKFGYIDEHIGR